MLQSNKKEKIAELKQKKKEIVKLYILFFAIPFVLAILSMIYTRWLMLPCIVFIVVFLRQALQLDNINRDLEVLKRSR